MEQKVQIVPIHPTSLPALSLSSVNISRQSTFVTVGEPVLKHHSHSKSRVHVPSWYGTFYGFRYMYNDILYIHNYGIIQRISTALKIICALCIHSSSPSPTPHNH